MKFKLNPLTGEFDYTSESANKQKLNPLTGEFNLVEGDGPFSQIFNPLTGTFNLGTKGGGGIIAEVTGNGYINLTNAVANHLMELKAYGGTEQSNLPKGYTQLEYLRSSGTQYIDLGYKGNGNTKVEVKFKYHTVTSATGSGRVFGSRITSSNNAFAIGTSSGVVASTNNKIFWCYDSQPFYVDNTEFGLDVWNTVVFSATEHTINGVTVGDNYEITEFETPSNLSLFAFDNNGTIGIGYVDIAYCKLWNNGVLVRDLIPCKNSSNVFGMYDRVSETLLTNAGTGTFTDGPNTVPTPTAPMNIISNNGVLKPIHQSGLPIGYTLLDYIQSGGSNYIDTGIKLTNEDIVEMQYLQTSDKGAIYGEYYNGTSNMSTTLYGNITFYFYGYNAGGTATPVGDYDTNVHTVVHNFVDGYIDFDGVRTNFDLPNPNSFTNTLNCPIFGRSNGSSIGYFSKTQLYYFRIRRNGTLILDLIPAKDSDNNVGMYDRVSGTLFTESGSGSFTAGNTIADPMTVYADGIVETINVHTRNLFNKNNAQVGKNWNGNNMAYSIASDYIPAKKGDAFTLSISDMPKYTNTTWVVLSSDYVYLGTVSNGSAITQDDCAYIRLSIRCANTDSWIQSDLDNAKIQLEKGSTATEYVPYFDGGTATAEMLLKIGDYADEQEILSGNITRKVGYKIFDGTESFTTSTAYGKACLIQSAASSWGAVKYNVLCTHFKGLPQTIGSQPDYTCFFNASGHFYFRLEDNTVATFKQWLTDQYNAGTPVIVFFALSTETTESVAGQTMNIPKGNGTIEITQASLDNLGLYAKYLQSN